MIVSDGLKAQIDGYFYDVIETRSSISEGRNYSMLSQSDYYGLKFQRFEESVDTGFEFGTFGFEADNANVILGDGFVLLTCLGVLYARKRNKKEDKN